mmetsp:Transcript_1802/g.1726  ORF Transcript_1802/g.1726 Transcript_1802/m.1726 type:complete len:164 (+) Transcript_1802:1158-1649(+)
MCVNYDSLHLVESHAAFFFGTDLSSHLLDEELDEEIDLTGLEVHLDELLLLALEQLLHEFEGQLGCLSHLREAHSQLLLVHDELSDLEEELLLLDDRLHILGGQPLGVLADDHHLLLGALLVALLAAFLLLRHHLGLLFDLFLGLCGIVVSSHLFLDSFSFVY